MKSSVRLAVVGGVAAAATTLLAGTSLAATQQRADRPDGGSPAGEVFVQTDALTGNAIAVYNRSGDGTLHAAGTYPTGGLGGALTGSSAGRSSPPAGPSR